jgi:hypothetical protein
MYPTFSRRGQRPKTHVTNPFRRAPSHRSHPALLKSLDITGSRWGVEGAEAVLRLRAVIDNSDFEAYWAFHLHREHNRVHHARDQDGYNLIA